MIEGKELKVLTPSKLLTRFLVLLAQIKAVNSSNKVKNEIRQLLYLLHQHNKITKKLIIVTETKTFHFDFPKEFGTNLKHEIYLIIKHNKLLTKYTIKNEVRQLLSKYEDGNNSNEHGKQ